MIGSVGMSTVQTDCRGSVVISVGSGHYGLIAAAYLAKSGRRVLKDFEIDLGKAVGVEQPVAVARKER